MNATVSVLIVGAGPTGMQLALELHRHGIDFLIIDKRENHVTTSNAAGIHAKTLECWHHKPWLKYFLQNGIKISHVLINAFNKKLIDFNFNQLKHTQYPYILSIPQNETEKIFDEYLKLVNNPVFRNATLLNLIEQNDCVKANIQTPEGQKEITAKWIVGCDGYHSTVRKKARIDFPETSINEKFILADVKLKANYLPDSFNIYLNYQGILAFFTMKQSTRIVAGVGHDSHFKNVTEPSIDNVRKIITERTSLQFQIDEIFWKSHFWIHECVAEKFQVNRIFLAGDAAHVHSPAGGQGMNTGIQDAYNLAWKLAYVIKGKIAPDLLETYELERRPIAKTVVSMSAMMTRLANIHYFPFLQLRNFIIPIIGKSKTFQQLMISRLSQLALRYQPNNYISGESKIAISAGERILDCMIDTKKNIYLYDLLADTHFHLLVFNATKEQENKLNLLIAKVDCLQLHFFNQTNELITTCKIKKFTMIMIRPDQYINYITNDFIQLEKQIKNLFRF